MGRVFYRVYFDSYSPSNYIIMDKIPSWKDTLTVERAKKLSRVDLAEWLQWNDPNGIWDDINSKENDLPKVTKKYALEKVIESLNSD